ncbi:MAG: hypothetical protein ACRCWS_08075, partial [Propionibacteriaceae bacterium]
MLTRLWSPAFKHNGTTRPAIEFHAGLNIVEGADGAQNSIGKSTLLQIIDYIYGGKDFAKSSAVTLPQAVGHHIVYFSLRINGTEHHFSRDTSRPGIVTAYSDPSWKSKTHELGIDEYAAFLLSSYGLAETGTTWRDLVGRFSRDDESDLALLDRPLASVPQEADTAGAAVLLRLLGAFNEIEQIQARYDQVIKETAALDTMAKGHYSNYIRFTKKSERDQAAKELVQARAQALQVRRQGDLGLFDQERQARNEQALLRAALRPVTEQYDLLRGKLALVEATLAGQTRITTEDLKEFYTFFPEAERAKLETIEFYHHELSGILADQLNEQRLIYQAQAAQLQQAIKDQKARIVALGESVQLDDETYNKSLELHTKITRLEEQINTYDRNQQLKGERKELQKKLEDVIPATLDALAAKLNTQMREINDSLYPDDRRISPTITFKAAKKGVSYTFNHNGDTGSGAKSKNL